MKKLLCALLCLAMTVAMFGCSSSSNEGSPTASDGGSSSQTSADGGESSEAPAEKIKMRLLSASITESPGGAVEQEIIDDFLELHPEIDLEVIGISSNDHYTKLTAMVTANDIPDVFSSLPNSILQFNDMGVIEPLNDLLGEEYMAGWLDYIEECYLDGQLLYAPWSSIPTSIIYRKDWVEEKGLELPKTWDECTEFFKALTEDTDGDGKIDRYGLVLLGAPTASSANRFMPMMKNCGASDLRIDENGNYVTDINTPGGIAMLNYYYQWANVDKVVPPGAGEIDNKVAFNLLSTEQAACVIFGPQAIATIESQNPDLKGKFAGAPFPTLDGSPSVTVPGFYGFSISSKSEHKELGAEYIKFLLSKDNFVKFSKVTYRLPTRADSVEATLEANPFLEGFYEATKSCYIKTLAPFTVEIDNAIAVGFNLLASGAETDAAKVAADLEQQINDIIAANT